MDASTYLVDRERKRSKNGDEGVVLDVIQITDDQRRTDGTSAFNTRTEQPRLLLLDPARGKERLMKIQQHDGVVVDAVVTAAGLRRSLRRRRRCWRGEGGAKGMGAAALPPSLYI